jgi:hypothetical protein
LPGPDERQLRGTAEAFAATSCCVLLVCLAYAGGRWHAGWAPAAYWAGEVLLVLSACFFGFYRRASWNARAAAILLFAGAQSVISWSYSPDMFRYSDELQHLRSLLTILQTHQLFGVNYSLPVSPQYPGLESATAAVVQTTQLSSQASGLLVVGVAHLVLTSALLLLFRQVSGSGRVAAAAALVYTLGTDQAIIRLFVYEALAMPFLVLALYLALRPTSPEPAPAVSSPASRRARTTSLLPALACAAVVTVTHPVTAIALVAILAVLGTALTCVPRGRQDGRRILVLAAASLALVALWIGLVSPTTLSYLGGPLYDAAYGFFSGGGAGTGTASGIQSSAIDRALTLSGPALTAVLVLVGVGYSTLKVPRAGSAVRRVWLVGGLAYFAVLVVRVFAARGVELAGRSLAYASLFSALVVGLVVARLASGGPRRSAGRRSRARQGSRRMPGLSPRWRPVALGVVLVLGVSGLASAIPPAYERLPGEFHPDAGESGIDAENVAAARWSASALGPGNVVFGDFTASTLWGTLGDQDTSRTSASMRREFVAPRLGRQLRHAVGYLEIRFIVSDVRITELPPLTGSYSAPGADPGVALRTTPLPRSSVTKFGRIPGVSRVYDSGNIGVYDLRGSSYAP